MLTMFAMVLAIGLLVDDAIVVVENVERIMSEEGLSPREATRKSMDQITSALIGIGLVLSAVFGPMAFFAGSTGVIYRQFLRDDHRFHASFGRGGPDPDAGSLCLTSQAGAKGMSRGGGIRLLRPFFRWFDRVFLKPEIGICNWWAIPS